MDDTDLLRRYARDRSEEAFAELVRRHVDLVYSAARRQVGGDAHRAKDVAQLVFTDLARKAGELAERPVLAGWLFTATRFAAAKIVRGEQRRFVREQEVAAMNASLGEGGSGANGEGDECEGADWDRLRPVIDEAMGELNERDREAVLLRFFEGRALAEIGRRLGLSENAARMRVERALEKLGAVLRRRGIASTSAALGVVLSAQAVSAAPVGVAAAISGAAVASAATVVASTAASATTGVAGYFSVMALTKMKTVVAVALLGVAAVSIGWQQRANGTLRAANDAAALRIRERAARVAAIRVEESGGAEALVAARKRASQVTPFVSLLPPENRLNDPEYLRLYRLSQRQYQGSLRLFRRLKLSPAETERLIDLLVERNLATQRVSQIVYQATRDVAPPAGTPAGRYVGWDDDPEREKRLNAVAAAESEEAIRALLGDERYAVLKASEDGTGWRWMADEFADTAEAMGTPLADAQIDGLKAVLAGNAEEVWDSDNQVHVLPERVVAEAKRILSPEQWALLARQRAHQGAAQELKEINRVAAARGLLNLTPSSAARYRASESATPAGPQTPRLK